MSKFHISLEDGFIMTDWSLLRKQKIQLLGAIEDSEGERREALTGILHMIDAIQDEAVQSQEATETEVFGGTYSEAMGEE